jgi:hypothetical protein
LIEGRGGDSVTEYDDFIERLEAALEHEDGREDFLDYLQNLTRQERTELLDEAERRDPEGSANWGPKKVDSTRTGGITEGEGD